MREAEKGEWRTETGKGKTEKGRKECCPAKKNAGCKQMMNGKSGEGRMEDGKGKEKQW